MSPRDKHFHRHDASALLEAMRGGLTTAHEVVKEHLERLNGLQTTLNAAVKIYDKEALYLASSMDVEANGHLPLFGLPCSVKETFDIAGEEVTSGSLRNKPVACESDAEMVRKLKSAGAIVIARSNIPEFAMTGESTNPRFGRCNNPLDVSRVAGGSSGGEGALVSSGSTAFGIGSDILGSIRIPAALCGIVGYKAHSQAIDGSGALLNATGHSKSWLGFGPLTRSVRDAKLVYNVIAEQAVQETTTVFSQFAIPEGFPVTYRQACIREALQAAQRALLNQGLTSRALNFEKVPKLFLLIPRMIVDDYYDSWIADLSSGPYGQFSTRAEVLKQLMRKGTIDSGLLMWLLLSPIMRSRRPGKREKIATAFFEAKNEYQNLIGADTVLLLPTLGLVAPKHKWFNRQSLMDPRVNGLCYIAYSGKLSRLIRHYHSGMEALRPSDRASCQHIVDVCARRRGSSVCHCQDH